MLSTNHAQLRRLADQLCVPPPHVRDQQLNILNIVTNRIRRGFGRGRQPLDAAHAPMQIRHVLAGPLENDKRRRLQQGQGRSHDRLGNECIGDGGDIHTTSCSYGISMPPLT